LGPFGTAATNRPIVPVPGDYDDGETGGMIGRGNRITAVIRASCFIFKSQDMNGFNSKVPNNGYCLRHQGLQSTRVQVMKALNHK
jgi:hypothetical protein